MGTRCRVPYVFAVVLSAVFVYFYMYMAQQHNIEPSGPKFIPVFREGNINTSTPTRTSADTGKWTIDTEKAMPDMDELWDRLMIVTAISENHFMEAKGMIGTAQQFMPDKKIIMYDLGLRNETLTKIREFCNVELRTFNFSRYPPHTANLMKYAWKVFIIRETLHEFGALFWGDASVRFFGSLRDVLPYIHLHHGYMSHIHSYDPKAKSELKHQYYYTHPNMYPKLNISRYEYYNAVNATPHVAANRQLIVNNSVLIKKLLDPLTECAMIEKCIEPEGAAYGIHRYDASALALLIYKNLRYEWTPENHNTSSAVLDKVCTTKRTIEDGHLAKKC